MRTSLTWSHCKIVAPLMRAIRVKGQTRKPDCLGRRGPYQREIFAGYSCCFGWNLNICKSHQAGQKEKLKRQVPNFNDNCRYWSSGSISKSEASVLVSNLHVVYPN